MEVQIEHSSHGIQSQLSRRDFFGATLAGLEVLAVAGPQKAAVVSVVRIANDNIRVAVEKLGQVRRKFARAQIYPWASIRDEWGVKEIKTDR